MVQTVFAICDKEKGYAEKLFEFIHTKESSVFKVVLFTKTEECQTFLKDKQIGILLISDECRREYVDSINAANTIILSKTHSIDTVEEAYIYKYQAAETILKKVMEYCAEKDALSFRRNCEKPLSIIGIYSPIKKAFQTTFAITLGQILAQKGKTLYLNFESFSGFDSVMASRNKADLMDLMYFWTCSDDKFSIRLESVIEHIGQMDYVPPVHSFTNYEGISGKQWLEFIKAFEEYSDYEYLILDLSENVNGLFDVLRICKSVFTVTDNRRISTAKLMQYESLLQESCYEDVIDKTRKIKIPVFREIPEHFDMLPYSDLAKYIKKELSVEHDKAKDPQVVL